NSSKYVVSVFQDRPPNEHDIFFYIVGVLLLSLHQTLLTYLLQEFAVCEVPSELRCLSLAVVPYIPLALPSLVHERILEGFFTMHPSTSDYWILCLAESGIVILGMISIAWMRKHYVYYGKSLLLPFVTALMLIYLERFSLQGEIAIYAKRNFYPDAKQMDISSVVARLFGRFFAGIFGSTLMRTHSWLLVTSAIIMFGSVLEFSSGFYDEESYNTKILVTLGFWICTFGLSFGLHIALFIVVQILHPYIEKRVGNDSCNEFPDFQEMTFIRHVTFFDMLVNFWRYSTFLHYNLQWMNVTVNAYYSINTLHPPKYILSNVLCPIAVLFWMIPVIRAMKLRGLLKELLIVLFVGVMYSGVLTWSTLLITFVHGNEMPIPQGRDGQVLALNSMDCHVSLLIRNLSEPGFEKQIRVQPESIFGLDVTEGNTYEFQGFASSCPQFKRLGNKIYGWSNILHDRIDQHQVSTIMMIPDDVDTLQIMLLPQYSLDLTLKGLSLTNLSRTINNHHNWELSGRCFFQLVKSASDHFWAPLASSTTLNQTTLTTSFGSRHFLVDGSRSFHPAHPYLLVRGTGFLSPPQRRYKGRQSSPSATQHQHKELNHGTVEEKIDHHIASRELNSQWNHKTILEQRDLSSLLVFVTSVGRFPALDCNSASRISSAKDGFRPCFTASECNFSPIFADMRTLANLSSISAIIFAVGCSSEGAAKIVNTFAKVSSFSMRSFLSSVLLAVDV
ncbi:unnamed protein product, partial [Notodromas monacha]